MARTKSNIKRASSGVSAYDVQRIILGALIIALVISAAVFILQDRLGARDIGQSETSVQQENNTPPSLDADVTIQEQ